MNDLKSILFILFCFVMQFHSWSQNASTSIAKKAYTTHRISKAETPKIDGQLDDAVWKKNDWASDFIQRTPQENEPPTYQTMFNILYDDKHLYIAIKSLDDKPTGIVKRMSRRDGNVGDWVEITFDSYHDLRTAFSFLITAAGVKGDKLISQNGAEEDESWNPIWYAKSSINTDGWVAEMKIPLSQLRFGKQAQQVWGLQVVRRFFRNEEQSVWQRIPLDAPGWISEFGTLEGLENLELQRQLEVQPYVVTALNTFEKEPDNPFRQTNGKTLSVGLDGKIGITNDLTLDFTINPDFGQVEADPSNIALDGFQLFFQERRPFFVENKNIFSYPFSWSTVGGTFGNDNLFYSRRIGRTPQAQASTPDDAYIKTPRNTTILGAVKLSGKTDKGLSIGIMESVTAREYATIDQEGIRRKTLVEPLTNYFVSRVQKDFNNRNTFIGGILTSTVREIQPSVNFLHRSALTGGIDFKHQWKNRTWYTSGNLVWSQVNGSPESILNTQQSIAHLYQRRDASHLAVDSSLTTLSGTGGDLKFGKAGGGHITFESGVTWRTPGLELNDLGFMRQADDVRHYFGLRYNFNRPFSIFREMMIRYSHWSAWDFEGNHNRLEISSTTFATFTNNWSTYAGAYWKPRLYSNARLQGGPRIQLADETGVWAGIASDPRKKVSFNLDGYLGNAGPGGNWQDFALGIVYQPFNRFNISLSPSYTIVHNYLQYLEEVEFENQPRYITAGINQETFRLTVKASYSINADLSIQYYGQPFITKGTYSNHGFVSDATANEYQDQFTFFQADQLIIDKPADVYQIDENQDGRTDYQFDIPDFSFAEFRSNFVIRWEYKPGSEVYLVWTQGISSYSNPHGGLYSNFKTQILDQIPDNTFLLKYTYRFVR